ncbi:MAG TPA: hypothetical protein VEZ90_06650 [Blastocatellia bacterium]|nr:hypothetical protein [Blastocatellia bacterium]
MRERAEEIGAKITLRSRPGSGTEVELMIPAHIAYSSDRPSLRTQELIRLLSWN